MNLPKDAIEFLDVFISLFCGCKTEIYNEKNLPLIHVYGFAKNDESGVKEIVSRIAQAFDMDYAEFKEKCGKNIVNIENVRDLSTRKVVYCVDMRLPNCVAFREGYEKKTKKKCCGKGG